MNWRKELRDFVNAFDEHDLLTSAAAIARQVLVAMVALALLGIAVLGEIGQQRVWEKQIAPQIRPKLLPAVFDAANATVDKIFSSSSVGLIVFASLLTIWMVSGVVRACMSSLSKIQGTKDEREWYIRFPISFGLAVIVTAALCGAFVLLLGLKHAVDGGWGIPFTIFRWLATAVLLTVAFTVLVRFAPAERTSKRFASIGSAVVVVAWLVQSVLFMWYARSLGNYKTAVGSLLFIYLFTTYVYVGSIVLLVGIQLDAQAHDAAARRRSGR